MSQQSEFAEVLWVRLRSGPVAVSSIVDEIRQLWGPDHGVKAVHLFIGEVIRCLISHPNVEVGVVRNGLFIAISDDDEDLDMIVEKMLLGSQEFVTDSSFLELRATW